ncbi:MULTISPECIES: serine/threonine-protein kinase [Niastella]|uniref:Serine/threonine protein kinase n=1 Tax=Niastella soli TaxID=2821487 RepID=A0ABS3Z1X3_9BACT|nr:serine/threonine-protein kinase [Niastella soli]MBO9203411.1 serine/threonine protein kinase [Niastella soli]
MATSIFKEYFKGYEILGEIGRGNARVLKARHLESGNLVAIKHFAFNTDADTLRRFQRESEIMKSIQHDHIVKIVDVHLDAELPYIVMQLIEGGDVRRLLKDRGTLEVDTVIQLAQHMTDALDAIHAKGVVHRDIKPENIMYRRLPNGELHFLLTDFGIAKLREQTNTVTGSSMLTYEYASPEQFSHARTVSTPTDYYSLGIVLYECLTGSVPFAYNEEDLLWHINRVIECPFPEIVLPDNRILPPSLLQLLHGLLAKQATFRMSDTEQVRQLLQKAAVENAQARYVKPVSVNKTKKVTQVHAKANVPAAGGSKKKEIVFTILGVLLFSGFMMGMWAVYPHKEGESGSDNAATVLPVDSVSVAAVTRKTMPSHDNKDLISPVVHANPETETELSPGANAKPAVQTDAGVTLHNGMYYDDFSEDVDSIWETGKDENSEFKFSHGKYIIKGFTDSLTYHATVKFDLNIERNFSISASATQWGNEPDEAYGINFCGNTDTDAYYVYYITSSGYYAIGSMTNGDWQPIINWTRSTNIRTRNDMNTLSIEKRNNAIFFYINDKVENVLPFTGAYGNCFGLRVDGAQTVAFDQLIVKGTR